MCYFIERVLDMGLPQHSNKEKKRYDKWVYILVNDSSFYDTIDWQMAANLCRPAKIIC